MLSLNYFQNCFFSRPEEFVNNRSVNTAESLHQEENNHFEENKTRPVSTDDDAVFRATVSNMKPEEVFNHPRCSGSKSRSESSRSHESPTRRL